jgi:hypothetical protein
VTNNIGQAPVNPDGSFSVSLPITKAGSYVAELPPNLFDGFDGNATYTGKSAGVNINIAP